MLAYAQLMQTLVTLSAAVVIGIAAYGSWRWRALQEFEKLAEARAQRIEQLEKELEYMRAAIGALEAQVAKLQRDEREWRSTELELRRELALLMPKGRSRRHMENPYQEEES